MNGTTTSTVLVEPLENTLNSSKRLDSSLLSLSSKQSSSNISKAYKQASSLFLTRRLPEALSALEPVITIQRADINVETEDDIPDANSALVATASRNTRIKVWSLYLTLLNAIVELGPQDGKNTFGSKEWKTLVAKARDASIWEEVVQAGYGGIEGNVDAEVVINLATLLLTHSPSQTTNQQRLESYLSSSSSQPDLSLSSHSNSTDTPRDLNSRIKILELYTLHVLPRTNEWQYARDFINMSEVLDDERRDAFLSALQTLQDEQSRDDDNDDREAQILREKDEQLEEEEKRRANDAKARASEQPQPRGRDEKGHHRRSKSERDYGIESSPRRQPDSAVPPTGRKKSPHSRRSHFSPTSRAAAAPSKRSTNSAKGNKTGVYKRSAAFLLELQRRLTFLAHSMSKNPMALMKLILFLVGLVMTFSRRDVRERVRRITGGAWDKVKGTVGMGVKVSYI